MLTAEPTEATLSQKRTRHAETPTQTVNTKSALNSAIAGYCAGVTGVILGHPLDSAKVWLQTNTIGRNIHLEATVATSSTPAATTTTTANSSNSFQINNNLKRTQATSSVTTASMSTLSPRETNVLKFPTNRTVSKTVRALYSGVSGPLVSVGIVQSINFTIYDAMRRILHRMDHPNAFARDYLDQDSLTNVATAGFVAGTCLAFITSPLIMIKTRQQITGNAFQETFRELILTKNGRPSLKGCIIGIYPHLISETVGRALYYSTYEASKRSICKYKEQQQSLDTSVKLYERMIAAGISGILCWSVIFPSDSLRSRMYNQEGPRRLSTTEMMKVMYGEKAFYRGFWLTILRAGPVAAVVLPVYDLVLEKLNA